MQKYPDVLWPGFAHENPVTIYPKNSDQLNNTGWDKINATRKFPLLPPVLRFFTLGDQAKF
jgi:hypothetical protein